MPDASIGNHRESRNHVRMNATQPPGSSPLRKTANASPTAPVSAAQWCVAVLLGLSLAAGVWRTLLQGGGLVGGDTYPYFFPQKQVLAEALRSGTLPLWHDRTGLGYPLHAESQAGVLYPSNQILYRLLDINTAYSVSIVLHYWLGYVFCWRFLRTQQVSQTSALLAAIVFIYGWFPARVSLEWSSIGAVWFPATLWLTDRLLDRLSIARISLLACAVATHLLAGHFTLAFISQLCCTSYALLKVGRTGRTAVTAQSAPGGACDGTPGRWWPLQQIAAVGGAIVLGLCLAAAQLLPTLELQQLSQRAGANTAFDPGYGHLPPVYLTQLVASWWYWHTPEMVLNRELTRYPFLSSASATNQVEAHLYFGLLPLLLLLSAVNPRLRLRKPAAGWMIWTVLSVLSVIYAFGWLIPVTRHLPGFGFFMGPGRYTLITTMGAAVLTGLALDAWLYRRSLVVRCGATVLIGVLTLPDLLWSSEYPVRDAVTVRQPPLGFLPDSWIAAEFRRLGDGQVRLLAPGPNVANLYGVSCVPQYLGLGPADYYTDEKTYRTQPAADDPAEFPNPDELQRLRERGVTHILATAPISRLSPALELAGSGPDAFLNAVWSRGSSPCYLYRLLDPPQRVAVEGSDLPANWRWIRRSPEVVEFEITLESSAVVTLRELMLPGWQVQMDGTPAVPLADSGFARQVQVASGTHTIRWHYQPASFRQGVLLSLITAASLCLVLIVSQRRNRHYSARQESTP